MHLLLRPAQKRADTGVRPGLPDRVDPLWADQRAEEEGPGPRRPVAQAGEVAGQAVRSGRKGARRFECVLPADGHAGDVWPAIQPEAAEPECGGLVAVERV